MKFEIRKGLDGVFWKPADLFSKVQSFVIDETLQKVLKPGKCWDVESAFSCEVVPTAEGWLQIFLSYSRLSLDQVLAVLEYLGSDGWDLLVIPEGKEEVEVVLGLIEIEGLMYVLWVEHECEPGKDEEIHLHVRPRPFYKEKIKTNLMFLTIS